MGADPLILYAVEQLYQWAAEEAQRENQASERWQAKADEIAGDPEKVEEHENLTYEATHAAGRSTGVGLARNRLSALVEALKEGPRA